MVQLNILLTGASGFVGSHVVKALEEHTLTAISTKVSEIRGVDNVYTWNQINGIHGPYDAVIHMAGLAHDTQNNKDESAYFDVNVGLTKTLLENMKRWNCGQFIYISSVKAAVDSTSIEVLNEDFTSTCTNVYGRSKLAAERLILDSDAIINRIMLRPVMIYGPGQKGNLNILEKLIHKGIWFPFKNWQNKRSVLSINNLTFAIKDILNKKIATGVYFIADDSAISTVDILKSIGKGINRKVRFVSITNGLIQFGLKLLPKILKSFTDKALGSLEVDNSKLKKALGISTMPHNTASDLPRAFKEQSSNV